MTETTKFLAQATVKACGHISAIGHQATAELLSEVLGVKVKYTRKEVAQKANQQAIVFQLNKRQQEGQVLTRDQIEKVGYKIFLLIRVI